MYRLVIRLDPIDFVDDVEKMVVERNLWGFL